MQLGWGRRRQGRRMGRSSESWAPPVWWPLKDRDFTLFTLGSRAQCLEHRTHWWHPVDLAKPAPLLGASSGGLSETYLPRDFQVPNVMLLGFRKDSRWQWGSLQEVPEVNRTLTMGWPWDRALAPLVGLDSEERVSGTQFPPFPSTRTPRGHLQTQRGVSTGREMDGRRVGDGS